jgi:hypothetical protein
MAQDRCRRPRCRKAGWPKPYLECVHGSGSRHSAVVRKCTASTLARDSRGHFPRDGAQFHQRQLQGIRKVSCWAGRRRPIRRHRLLCRDVCMVWHHLILEGTEEARAFLSACFARLHCSNWPLVKHESNGEDRSRAPEGCRDFLPHAR